MKVSEAMHRNTSWVSPTMPVWELAMMMKEQDIGALPVGENDRLIGMVTDRDIAIRAFASERDVSALTARDVMSSGVVWCRDEEPIEEAVHRMEARRVRRMPVVDGRKRMVGMLSLGDVSHRAGPTLTAELTAAVTDHH